MKVQINKYQKLLEDLKAKGISLPEKFVVGVLIEKLLDSWNDYKNSLKHNQTNFTIEDIVTHILIEDTNRKESFKAKELALKANLVQDQNNNNRRYGNSLRVTSLIIPILRKKKDSCFTCGKSGHHTSQCRRRIRNDKENMWLPS